MWSESLSRGKALSIISGTCNCQTCACSRQLGALPILIWAFRDPFAPSITGNACASNMIHTPMDLAKKICNSRRAMHLTCIDILNQNRLSNLYIIQPSIPVLTTYQVHFVLSRITAVSSHSSMVLVGGLFEGYTYHSWLWRCARFAIATAVLAVIRRPIQDLGRAQGAMCRILNQFDPPFWVWSCFL